MQIGSPTSALPITPTQKSGSSLPANTPVTGNIQPEKPFIRELAESFDPKNMSYKESMDLANALMKAGEGDLSSAFLPPPLLKANSDGSVRDKKGTPEGDAKMSSKYNTIYVLPGRVYL